MSHLEIAQKEVSQLQPDEFFSFREWFRQMEVTWKAQYIADLRAGLPETSPTELMKLLPEKRLEILSRAAALAKLTNLNQSDELKEWLEIATDDGLTDE
jgi:regulator of sirC expression with transglutaminase-like and TPR domain